VTLLYSAVCCLPELGLEKLLTESCFAN